MTLQKSTAYHFATALPPVKMQCSECTGVPHLEAQLHPIHVKRLHLDISQAKLRTGFNQKTGFLSVAVEQLKLSLGKQNRQGNAGQTRSGANIKHSLPLHQAGNTETVEQMAVQHLRRVAHGGQIVSAVPFVQQRQIIQQQLLLQC